MQTAEETENTEKNIAILEDFYQKAVELTNKLKKLQRLEDEKSESEGAEGEMKEMEQLLNKIN
jgi:hypothetical protein